MTASSLSFLLQELKDRHIDITVDAGGKLKASAPDGQMTAGILSQLREFRDQIIESLKSESDTFRIGVEDDFFALGGNSLLAMQMIAKVNKAFKVDLPLTAAFEYNTVSALAQVIRESESTDIVSLQPVDTSRGVIATGGQRGFWLVSHVEGSGSMMNIVRPIRIEGDLDIAALEAASAELVRRHDGLRACFVKEGKNLLMKVKPQVESPWTCVDIRDLAAPEREQKVRELIRAQSETRFSLAEPPLIRLMLIVLAERSFVLVLSMHHIISDAWSFNVIKREMAQLYGALSRGDTPAPDSRPIHFPDYVHWYNQLQRGEKFERQIEYWLAKFRSLQAIEALPVDYPPEPIEHKRRMFDAVNMKYIDLQLPNETVQALQAVSQKNSWTVFAALLAVLQLSLHRYSGKDRQVVILPLAGRGTRELWDSVGLYMQMIMIVADIDPTKSLKAFVEDTKRHLYESADNAIAWDASLEKARVMGLLGSPPVATQFNYIDFPNETEWSFPGLKVGVEDSGIDVIPAWNIGMNVIIHSGTTVDSFAALGFNTGLFAEQTALRIRDSFQALAKALSMQPDALIRDVCC